MQPYSAAEKYAILRSKQRADVTGEQLRMDCVWRGGCGGGELWVGNKFAAEDAHYLQLQGVTHLLNTANNLVIIRYLLWLTFMNY